MKSLFLFVLIAFGLTANATNYYVSNSGNDSNNGTDPSTAWKTLDKVNSFNEFMPGDKILFKKGDTFYGTITVSNSGSSGSPITYGAYGTGANPVITGFTTVSSWTNLGSNIWESSSAVSSLSTCNVVVINGVNTAMGRYPNSGYLTYESYSGNTSITSSSLTGTPNWTGAEVVIKKFRYVTERHPITSHSGSKLTYSGGGSDGQSGWGFFIQNDVRTLDQQNEWYYNTYTRKIQVYSISMPTNVTVASLSNLFSASGKSYIVVEGIDFTGANSSAFDLSGFSHSTVQNCTIDFNYNAINGNQVGSPSTNLLFQNNIINHSNNSGFHLPDEFGGTIISGNLINNSGLLGMGGSGQSMWGIDLTGDNYLVENNEVDTTAYVGIGFNGSNCVITQNLVNYFCYITDDGGGIYTGNPQTGVVISNNIVLNGIGADDGTGSNNNGKASGIYCDDNSSGMSILNNSIANIIHGGIFIHNGKEIKIRGNTTFNCGVGLLVDNDNAASYTTGMSINANFLVASTIGTEYTPQNQICNWFKTSHTSGNDIANFGTADSNYYARPINDNSTIIGTIYGVADNYYSLSTWKTYSGKDAHSNKSPILITNSQDLLFAFNSTKSTKTISLNASYVDLTGKNYNGSVSLEPFTSKVLIKNGAVLQNQLPTANAGPNILINLPVSKASITGSGADADGQITNFYWKTISGPSDAKIDNVDSPSIVISNLVEGDYKLELVVTDDKGGTGKDTVEINVNAAANRSPTCYAGADQTIILPINKATLSGSGKDSDGSISSYMWSLISGPSNVGISSSSSASTDVTNLIEGVYQFQLAVTDDKGAIEKDTVKITVNQSTNIAPTANAGSNKTINLPVDSIELSGTGSDVDGIITSYSWTKISGPSGGKISNPNSASTKLTNFIQGLYKFELQVMDDKGATGEDIVEINVDTAINAPPKANAGQDQTIKLPATNVILYGAGNDTDGTIVSYNWTKISGPSTGSITKPDSALTGITNLSQGVYEFELKVTDNEGYTGKDSVKVTVNAPNNVAPTANAGADKEITLPSNSVSLFGSGKDADGTIESYSWTKLSGPAADLISNPNSATTTISELVQGLYQFELKVTDNKGDVGTDTVVIQVHPVQNQSPIAHAGNNQTITLPTNSITLAGSATDTDGTIVSYKWTKKNGASGETINNSYSAYTTVNGLIQGDYTFELTVTDDDGAIGTDTVHILVNPVQNQLPIANAGDDQSITLPTNQIILSGSGTDTDGKISSYKWTKLSGPTSANISKPAFSSTAVTGLTEGIYHFQLSVTDDKGATASSTVTITVKAANVNNVSPIANAGSDKSVTLPTNKIMLSGSGSDADGTVEGYQWKKISGPTAFSIVNSSSAVINVSGMIEGVYVFELTVTDDKGATGTSTVTVTVRAAADIPPTANAGADQTIALPTNNATLSGSGNDVDGPISNYSWTQISGPSSGTINNANSASAKVDNLIAGVYQFELQVTDNNGGTGKDTVVIYVNSNNNSTTNISTPTSNSLPIAYAGSDTTVVAPVDFVTLNGSGSDKDGNITSYSWSQLSGPSPSIILSNRNQTPSISNLTGGTYSFELTVTDDKGAVGKDTVNVTVALGRYAPLEPKIVNVYPNPVHDIATLEINTGRPSTNIGVIITDMSGHTVYNQQFVSIVNRTTDKINMSNLIKGTYVVSVYFDGTKAEAVKVLKL
jgi:hypothetical protein